MSVDELCDKMIELKKAFDEMYCNGNLIAINGGSGDIHVTTAFLLKIPGEMQKQFQHRIESNYPWEFSKMYRGIRFFSIEENENGEQDENK